MKQIVIMQVLGTLKSGGTETMIMNIYKNIDHEKYKFIFISHDEKEYSYTKEIINLGGEIYYLPKYKIYNHFEYKNRWKELFNKIYVDIVHAHLRTTAGIYLKIAKKMQLKTILHSHSVSSRGNVIERVLKRFLQYRNYRFADLLLSCSKQAAEWLFGKKNENNNNYIMIYNSIDIDKFRYNDFKRKELRSSLQLIDRDILIGHIGSFTHAKNHEKIIRVFSSLRKLNKNYKLLLVGNGILMEKIKRLSIKKNVFTNIIFIEETTRVSDYLSAMDLFIFPSIYEGLGMALIEAQANGLTCFVSDKIPEEAIVFENTYVLKLKENDIQWSQNISKIYSDKCRRDIDSSKLDYFNIYSTTRFLEKIYNDLNNGLKAI